MVLLDSEVSESMTPVTPVSRCAGVPSKDSLKKHSVRWHRAGMFWAEPNGYTFVCSHVTSNLRQVGGLAKEGVEQMREVEKDERMTESALDGTTVIWASSSPTMAPTLGGWGGGPLGLRGPVVGQ